MGPEKKFENQVKKWLDELYCTWYFKVHGTAATGAGVPDIIASVNGIFVGFEIKADNGKLSEIQKAKFRKIFNDGGLVFVVYPNNFREIKEAVENLDLADNWMAIGESSVWETCRRNLRNVGVKDV